MDASLYVATAGQRVLKKQLAIVANNIANSNTVGFRAESVEFRSLVSSKASQSTSFPAIGGLQPSLDQGAVTETGNPLDIALSGKGWFGISTPNGVAYTRDGRMQISPFGELQSLEGFSVLDASEAPILLNTSAGPPEIQKDGRIVMNGRIVGNIGVFDIDKQNLMSRYTNSAFLATTPGVPIPIGDQTIISQGYLESSNVNPMKELTRLIAITRNFESVSAVIDRADKTISKSVNELAGN